jgi:hypothetical protein
MNIYKSYQNRNGNIKELEATRATKKKIPLENGRVLAN